MRPLLALVATLCVGIAVYLWLRPADVPPPDPRTAPAASRPERPRFAQRPAGAPPARSGFGAEPGRSERLRARIPGAPAPQPPARRVAPQPIDPEVTEREVPADVVDHGGAVAGEDGEAPDGRAAIVYDGGGERVFATDSEVEIGEAGNINPGAGTVAFWLKPQWEANSADGGTFVRLGENGLQIAKDGDLLRFSFVDDTGAVQGGTAEIGEWQPEEWHYITATWQGGALALYIDGGQIFINQGIATPRLDGATVRVGASRSGAVAELSHLLVMRHDVSGEQVREMYESGGAAPQ